MKPATNAARALLSKLEALTQSPGTPDEGKAAQKKLDRLRKRYDFSQADVSKDDIFRKPFKVSSLAAPIARFETADFDVGNAVKWGIEYAAGVPCRWRDGELLAQVAPSQAGELGGIASTISAAMLELWKQYAQAVNPLDRALFVAGLYDGMMNETRPLGQALPRRADCRPVKGKRRAVGHVAGFAVHPYTVAVGLGKQIRFSVPLAVIAADLQQQTTPKEITT